VIDLRTPLQDYLAVRRQLGFKLKEAGWGLEDFVGFLERAGAERVTTELDHRRAGQLPTRASNRRQRGSSP
jgi:hypothetical protein